jgi:metallophosphoesterase (TIGR00282 family)
MIGDVVGELGLKSLERKLPRLIQEMSADFVIINGENVADGFGVTEAHFKRLIAAGADVVTSGNHIWEKRDFLPFLAKESRILRPANYPPENPGHGVLKVEKNGVWYIALNLQGREAMRAIDCPFRAFDRIFETEIAAPRPAFIIVDFHAETTQEKEAMSFYLDGRVTVLAGTHTHVQTADNRILPKGSAYITDLGMTGVTDSVIGMDTKICVERARKQVPYHMECAAGEAALQGVIVTADAETGKALTIERLND